MIRGRDLTNRRFGRLIVVAHLPSSPGKARWKCKCDCGNEHVVRAGNLINGNTKSCGCFRRGKLPTYRHGQSHTRTHNIWWGMLQRCRLQTHEHYHSYGGRGISVCERWETFENFWHDMGDCPPKLQLERVDNNGNYEPGNCRWATNKEQGRNRRTNVVVTHKGVSMCISAWAEKVGANSQSLWRRLRNGWPVEKALTAPYRANRLRPAASPPQPEDRSQP